MTVRNAVSFVIPLLLLQSCLKDPDPIPETIDTYQYYYNYFLEPYTVQWEMDDEIIGSGHHYGVPARAIVSLKESVQEVLIRVMDSENGLLLDSLGYTMYETGAYMTAILGSEEDPVLICETLNTRPPSSGAIKLRFMHASPALGPVDIYIGGKLSDNIVLSSVEYSDVTEYIEETELDLWEEITMVPAGSLPADTTILSYTANTYFQTGGIYFCIIGHTDNSIESSYQIQVDEHPVY